MSSFPLVRPRRLRQTKAIRELVKENRFSVHNLIYPLFVLEGKNLKIEIPSMPECYKHSLDSLLKEIEEAQNLNISNIALFPVIGKNQKTNCAKEAYNPNGLIPLCIKEIKKNFPDICIISDIALDPYTVHGHDGISGEKGEILNDETIEILCKMALCHAEAGSDIVAPSDMMDGRILRIRQALDSHKFQNTMILSYSAKYASAFYGPFRDALNSQLAFGDKKTYQMDCANAKEAIKEILLDEQEGADMIMIKPGIAYLDILYRASESLNIPIIAYSVSGEYSMIKASVQSGWLDEREIVIEMMTSFKRAGATGVITYHAKDIAKYLRE